ncbi:DUF6064 family protein [Aurantimonas coralicida]|uniref:DUF6064 family protein n=1 Tax=Aurantimonas coralicida TaxID=182270 RepID=UPI001E61F823|nr:DUF6064 family protein [Aurantimonas coralicida]MCD1644866.1 DUF6064 family protein [Aurantimonas coralicida]
MLADLSTYSLQDFLLFDAAIYRDLFAQLNARAWPLPVVGIAAALACLALATARHRWALPASAALLAAAFATSAWLFFLGVYATINWAAIYPGWAFVAEAGLLLVASVVLGRSAQPRVTLSSPRLLAGTAFALYGLFVHPLAGWLFGRAARGLEWFALAADPTALVAIGLLAVTVPQRRLALSLAALPLLWLAASAMTLWLLETPGEALLLAAAPIVGLVVLLLPARRLRENAVTDPLPAIKPAKTAAVPRGLAATFLPTSPRSTRTERA